MKNAIMYCFALVAMAFAMFATPAMAVEGWDDRNLIAAHAGIMPEIVAIDDRPMLAEYSARPQLEAADILASKSGTYIEVVGMAKPINEGVTGDGPFERGWRVSTTAT